MNNKIIKDKTRQTLKSLFQRINSLLGDDTSNFLLCSVHGKDYKPDICSTTDHWIQKSIKRIFNSGLFGAVRAAKKSKL